MIVCDSFAPQLEGGESMRFDRLAIVDVRVCSGSGTTTIAIGQPKLCFFGLIVQSSARARDHRRKMVRILIAVLDTHSRSRRALKRNIKRARATLRVVGVCRNARKSSGASERVTHNRANDARNHDRVSAAAAAVTRVLECCQSFS